MHSSSNVARDEHNIAGIRLVGVLLIIPLDGYVPRMGRTPADPMWTRTTAIRDGDAEQCYN